MFLTILGNFSPSLAVHNRNPLHKALKASHLCRKVLIFSFILKETGVLRVLRSPPPACFRFWNSNVQKRIVNLMAFIISAVKDNIMACWWICSLCYTSTTIRRKKVPRLLRSSFIISLRNVSITKNTIPLK